MEAAGSIGAMKDRPCRGLRVLLSSLSHQKPSTSIDLTSPTTPARQPDFDPTTAFYRAVLTQQTML